MSDARNLRLRQTELAFLGEIGAETSHEMRNVLSVISEYAGLMEDLLALADKGRPLDQVRLKKLAGNVVRQVGKGTETMTCFSRLARTADKATATFDLAMLTATTVSLTRRHFARSNGTVHAELPDEEIAVTSSPLAVQHAIFAAIHAVLASMEDGGRVTIKLTDRGDVVAIGICGDTPAVHEFGDRIEALATALGDLDSMVEEAPAEGRPALILSIPKACP